MVKYLMTYNELIERIANRAGKLSIEPIDNLRLMYPMSTEIGRELIQYCKEMNLNKQNLVSDILFDEFAIDNDYELDQDICGEES